MNIQYCRKCGTHLRIVRKEIIGYTQDKGMEIRKAYLECPMKLGKWFDPHDSWEGHTIEGEEDNTFHFDSRYMGF